MSITFEEAKERALAFNKNINVCYEYKAAYHFFDTNDAEIPGVMDMVILKETGKEIGFTSFLLDYHPEKRPKRRFLFPKKRQ